MRKKLILSTAVFAVCLATLTGCGTKLTANPLTLEAGDPVPDDILEYVTISGGDTEEVLANAVLSAEDIDNMTAGSYTVTVTYGKQTVEVSVDVVDTTAPSLEEKSESFSIGDDVTVDDLVTIEDCSDVESVLIDEDGNETDTVTAKEGMTVTVRVTDEYENVAELEISPDVFDSASELYGTWAATFDISNEIESGLESDFAGFHEDFDMMLMMDFYEDGTFKIYVDEETFTDTFNAYVESLAAFGTEIIYNQLAAEGHSRKEINSTFVREYGMGIEEFMFNEFQKNVDINELLDSVETTGVFEVKGNKLYIDEFSITPYSYDLFTIEGDVLTIDAAEGADTSDLMGGFEYPYVFNRVQ